MTKKSTTKAPHVEGSIALWIMTPFGILMPAGLPANVAKQHPAGVLQLRSRDRAHLEAFRVWYCPELGPTTDTPTKDYDCRAYVHKDDLARAVARMVLEIDAPKFKPLTHSSRGLHKAKADRLHGVYLKIWGSVCALSDKPWTTAGKNTVISKPDPEASAEICQREGHCFPTGTKGGSVRVVHCSDCDALKNTSTGRVHYPKSHVRYGEPVSV